MRLLDRKLKTPHRLAIFAGGHTLPPDTVAMEAIEWMEIQAMKSGRRQRDDAMIDRLLAKRRSAIAGATSPVDTVRLLEAIVADFTGLRDVSAEGFRAKELSQQSDVKKAIARDRSSDDVEMQMLSEIFELERGLGDADRHNEAMLALRDRLSRLAKKAAAETESPERSQAVRVLRSITGGASDRVQDRDYAQLLAEFGGGRRGR
jgi:hypothetical protein